MRSTKGSFAWQKQLTLVELKSPPGRIRIFHDWKRHLTLDEETVGVLSGQPPLFLIERFHGSGLVKEFPIRRDGQSIAGESFSSIVSFTRYNDRFAVQSQLETRGPVNGDASSTNSKKSRGLISSSAGITRTCDGRLGKCFSISRWTPLAGLSQASAGWTFTNQCTSGISRSDESCPASRRRTTHKPSASSR